MDISTWRSIQKQLCYELSRSMGKVKAATGIEAAGLAKDLTAISKSFNDDFTKTKAFIRELKDDLRQTVDMLHSQSSRGRIVDIKGILERREKKLFKYRMEMREDYENLVCEEKLLDKDLSIFTASLDALNDAAEDEIEDPHNRQQAISRRNRELENQSKIGTIDKKLAILGAAHGLWEISEHDAFVRLLKQRKMNWKMIGITDNNDRSRIVLALASHFRGKTKEEISDHIEFHIQYESLLQEKQELLRKWRAEQNARKQSILDTVVVTDSLPEAQENKASKISVEENLEKKQKVLAWKQEQVALQMKIKEEEAIQNQVKKLEESESRARKQLTTRRKLDAWKDDRAKSAPSKHVVEEPRIPVSFDPAILLARQQRNLEAAKQAREKIIERKSSKLVREERQRAAGMKVQNDLSLKLKDPTRLHRLTTASENSRLSDEYLDHASHRRESCTAHAANIPLQGYDLKFSGRAQPSWIQRSLL